MKNKKILFIKNFLVKKKYCIIVNPWPTIISGIFSKISITRAWMLTSMSH